VGEGGGSNAMQSDRSPLSDVPEKPIDPEREGRCGFLWNVKKTSTGLHCFYKSEELTLHMHYCENLECNSEIICLKERKNLQTG
jgi:hypothetical protein